MTTPNATMKIGIAQIDCQVGDVEANCRTMRSMIEDAAAAICPLIASASDHMGALK